MCKNRKFRVIRKGSVSPYVRKCCFPIVVTHEKHSIHVIKTIISINILKVLEIWSLFLLMCCFFRNSADEICKIGLEMDVKTATFTANM